VNAVLSVSASIRRRIIVKRTLRFVMVVAISLMFAEASQAGYCYELNNPNDPNGFQAPDPPNTLCGTVEKLTALGSVTPAKHYTVLMCRSGVPCWSVVTSTRLDFNLQPVEAFTFRDLDTKIPSDPLVTYPSATFTFNAFSTEEPWGQSNWTLDTHTVSTLGLANYKLVVPPKAIPPATIYPNDGNMSVPDHYYVRWYSGIDIDRARYRATWDVYYKYWPFNQEEPRTFTLSAGGIPCHPDGSGPDKSGNCLTYVAGPQPIGNWKWFVRVNLYIPQGVSTADSPVAFFREYLTQ
jgi:hypothetical protein